VTVTHFLARRCLSIQGTKNSVQFWKGWPWMRPDGDRVHTRHGKGVDLSCSRGAGKRTADCAAMQDWCWSGYKVGQGFKLKLAKLICRRDRPASVVYGSKCEGNRLKTRPTPSAATDLALRPKHTPLCLDCRRVVTRSDTTRNHCLFSGGQRVRSSR
jgi:hypothetical protein